MNNDSWIIIADDVPAAALSFMAKPVSGKVTAIVAGSRERAEAVAQAGIDEVLWYETSDSIPPEAWAVEIAKAAEKAKPRVILSVNMPMSRVLLGSAAIAVGAPVTSSIISVATTKSGLLVKRAIAEGRAVEALEADGHIAGTIIEGSPEGEAPAQTAKIIAMADKTPSDNIKIEATNFETEGAGLISAERVVSLGAGIGSKDKIEMIKQLAEAFHAEVSCSLPICDNYRWFDSSRVVGSSSQKISPRIYLAIGISGQPQHMMGVRGAKTIVAVNNDPDAPIFKKCNYGIVGDLNKIVPVLTKSLAEV